MTGRTANRWLKGVSRSFYLSLRLLPREMRPAAGLGYLLARTSDTIADSSGASIEARLLCLDWFDRSLAGAEPPPRWPLPVLNAVADPRERQLLEGTGDLLAWLADLPAAEAVLVRGVVATIIGGQRLDLERFDGADTAQPHVLADDRQLDDYTWRVAGCVGEFWTQLGFLTLGDGFSKESSATLLDLGRAYGSGLQLVNILRDLPADLAAGRCYLPVADPHDRTALLAAHQAWLAKARDRVNAGFPYAASLRSRRLRAASGLPARIAVETLDRLAGADWETLEARIKVPRRRVYLAAWRAFF